MRNKSNKTDRAKYFYFFLSIIYAILVPVSLFELHISRYMLYGLIGMVIVFLPYKSYSPPLELATIIGVHWILGGHANIYFFYLPLVSSVLIFTCYPIRRRIFILLTWIAMIPMVAGGLLYIESSPHLMGFILIFTTVISLSFITVQTFKKEIPFPDKIDIILCSYSSNTAHYTQQLTQSLEKSGVKIIQHRFHYHKTFNPSFKGSGLIIAFPVYCWKPPWTLVSYFVRKMPKGRGKPVFIIYTSAGGPENTAIITWLILTLKGYSVVGRSWAIYPINVVTFRLGLGIIWKKIDRLFPSHREPAYISKVGTDLANSVRTGLPFIIWPFPLVVLGFLFENSIINRFLYKTYVWSWRCTRCYLCVNYCPSQRFSIQNGLPKSKGECTLCLSCINLCPKNAMQMILLSEYGRPYKPRWPHLLIKPGNNVQKHKSKK